MSYLHSYSNFFWAFFVVALFSSNGSEARVSSSANDFLSHTPVVLWHGMGDSCCNPLSMGYIGKLIKKSIPGIYVRSLMLGNNVLEDIEHGFFANMNTEVRAVCEAIKADDHLKNGYNIVGFSQGGLFARALVQRCPSPPIKNLISIGGPQQGIFGLPLCPSSDSVCSAVRTLLDYGAYNVFVQRKSVQAQYWHDPRFGEDYRKKSIFLADLNCEREADGCDPAYKGRMTQLSNFVLVKFLRDQMVVPKESSWFGFYNESDTQSVVTMEETSLYKNDLIGLKALNGTGRLHLIAIDGLHLQISSDEFVSKIVKKYLLD